MGKRITPSQLMGEIGETAVKQRFLRIGFQFDARGRLEAGIDGIAELMVQGSPSARMIAVQVKATTKEKYAAETEHSFSYRLKQQDVEYWKNTNLPIIIVLYRQEDESFFWKDVSPALSDSDHTLHFEKSNDVLDENAVDRLAALTVPKFGAGHYVPPLRDGESALVNMLPISLPDEIYVASTGYNGQQAAAVLLDNHDDPRFDWAIKGGTYWSFHDPRENVTSDLVDLDQVEAVETSYIAEHEEIDEQSNFAFLLRQTLRHQYQRDLRWRKDKGILYFAALDASVSRTFSYDASKKKATTTVVNAVLHKEDKTRVAFVRHHAFEPRFENIMGQWHLIVTPTYYFTVNGFIPHSFPDALLSGKKRLDNNASLRGQLIMWHRFLTDQQDKPAGLFDDETSSDQFLKFGEPPEIELPTTVPEDVWGAANSNDERKSALEEDLLSHEL